MGRKEIAIKTFEEGFDCDKAVVTAFEKDVVTTKVEEDCLHTLAPVLPGQMHEKCGAVKGAGCVIFHFQKYIDNAADGEALWSKFKERFKEKHGSIKCKELLGYDLSVKRDAMEVQEQDLLNKICKPMVADAVDILEELIK